MTKVYKQNSDSDVEYCLYVTSLPNFQATLPNNQSMFVDLDTQTNKHTLLAMAKIQNAVHKKWKTITTTALCNSNCGFQQ